MTCSCSASFVQNFNSSWVEYVCIYLKSVRNCWVSCMQAARCTMLVPFKSLESWLHPFHLATWLTLDALFHILFTHSFSDQQDLYSHKTCWWLYAVSFVPVVTLVSAFLWRSYCLLSLDYTPFPSKTITVRFGLLNCSSLFQDNKGNLWMSEK